MNRAEKKGFQIVQNFLSLAKNKKLRKKDLIALTYCSNVEHARRFNRFITDTCCEAEQLELALPVFSQILSDERALLENGLSIDNEEVFTVVGSQTEGNAKTDLLSVSEIHMMKEAWELFMSLGDVNFFVSMLSHLRLTSKGSTFSQVPRFNQEEDSLKNAQLAYESLKESRAL